MARLMISREPRGPDGLPPGAVLGAMSLHALAIAVLAWGTARIAFPAPAQVYQVELVAAPQPAPVREVPAKRTTRTPPKAKPKPKRRVETKPALTEKPRETAKPAETKKEESAEKEPAVERRAAASPKEGKAELPVRLEGAPFPYPEYLENLILQIKRHWRPPAGGQQLRAELAFTIFRDGTVGDVRWIRRSGIPAFDLDARGAIETAGRRRAFGPLPDDYPVDQLRVSFFFDPTRY